MESTSKMVHKSPRVFGYKWPGKCLPSAAARKSRDELYFPQRRVQCFNSKGDPVNRVPTAWYQQPRSDVLNAVQMDPSLSVLQALPVYIVRDINNACIARQTNSPPDVRMDGLI